MRGFLALGVFIHHSSVWYQYIHTGNWDPPRSNLYNQLGQTSVSLFFMITSFLFITKLMNSSAKGFNWRDFFLSRLFRLAPMYFFSISILIVLVMFLSKWKLNVEIPQFIKSIVDWGLFTINNTPGINNSSFTTVINAKVVWSLPYEWLFYFSLPVISLAILKVKPQYAYIIFSIAFITLFLIMHEVKIEHLYSFIGGAIPPVLLKYTSLNKKAVNSYSNILILVCL
ncbi:MAG: acyltransferase, partial [Bacteroidota bacterium]